MFESLSDKLGKALRNLRGVGRLSEDNVADALGEVRKALLSADVHFKTAREFVDEVKQACLRGDSSATGRIRRFLTEGDSTSRGAPQHAAVRLLLLQEPRP